MCHISPFLNYRRIGRDLSQTCAKMERLAEMAKKKSLFDEKSDMDHLSRIVKEVSSYPRQDFTTDMLNS